MRNEIVSDVKSLNAKLKGEFRGLIQFRRMPKKIEEEFIHGLKLEQSFVTHLFVAARCKIQTHVVTGE